MSSDDSMGQDYTVHHDGPRANGSGSNGAQKLSAEQELIGALLTNPALLAVVADVGLQEAHFAQGSGFRGAFRFAPQGAEQIREILKNGQRGTTFNLLALLVELNVRISEQRAEHLARAIIAGAESRRDSSEKDEQSTTASTRHKEKQNIHGWDSPDWSILDERRGTLPEFPLDTMPLACRDWISRAAYGAGVTIGRITVSVIGVVSSLIGTARRVRVSRPWSEPVTLWTCDVGLSGDRKTPALGVIQRALDAIEKDYSSEVAAARLAHETRAQRSKEMLRKWKEERQAALTADPPTEPPPKPPDAIDPGAFVAPRLYATDPTIERLSSLLQARPRGMTLLRDELSGLFVIWGATAGVAIGRFGSKPGMAVAML